MRKPFSLRLIYQILLTAVGVFCLRIFMLFPELLPKPVRPFLAALSHLHFRFVYSFKKSIGIDIPIDVLSSLIVFSLMTGILLVSLCRSIHFLYSKYAKGKPKTGSYQPAQDRLGRSGVASVKDLGLVLFKVVLSVCLFIYFLAIGMDSFSRSTAERYSDGDTPSRFVILVRHDDKKPVVSPENTDVVSWKAYTRVRQQSSPRVSYSLPPGQGEVIYEQEKLQFSSRQLSPSRQEVRVFSHALDGDLSSLSIYEVEEGTVHPRYFRILAYFAWGLPVGMIALIGSIVVGIGVNMGVKRTNDPLGSILRVICTIYGLHLLAYTLLGHDIGMVASSDSEFFAKKALSVVYGGLLFVPPSWRDRGRRWQVSALLLIVGGVGGAFYLSRFCGIMGWFPLWELWRYKKCVSLES
jgi:hypothetical protein